MRRIGPNSRLENVPGEWLFAWRATNACEKIAQICMWGDWGIFPVCRRLGPFSERKVVCVSVGAGRSAIVAKHLCAPKVRTAKKRWQQVINHTSLRDASQPSPCTSQVLMRQSPYHFCNCRVNAMASVLPAANKNVLPLHT